MSEINIIKTLNEKGLIYSDYAKNFKDVVENTDERLLSGETKELHSYKKMNLQRSARIDRTYSPSAELIELIAKIKEPQFWIVITEQWCGDSAQNLPYIAKLASLNPLVQFKILYRDENPEIMNLYLTNGSRSIPIFAAFDKDGAELFHWGPRPNGAVELVKNAKAEGLGHDEFIEKLHLWYGRNRGAELEAELKLLLEKTI